MASSIRATTVSKGAADVTLKRSTAMFELSSCPFHRCPFPRDLSPGEDSRDHLIGRVEREKVARVLYDAELRARDRSGIGGPLIVAGPVVVPVEQERRPVNALVLPASGFPTSPVAYQRHERPIVVPSVADQIHLSGQRLRQGLLA